MKAEVVALNSIHVQKENGPKTLPTCPAAFLEDER